MTDSEALNDQVAPGWRDIEAFLRKAIENNEFEVGGQIPTEAELMQRLGATRYSVRRALNALQQGGLVRIEQGRGTFVHDAYLVSYNIGRRARFTDVLIANNITPAQEILRIETVTAPEQARLNLKLPEGGQAMFVELLGYADGQVVKHDINYFPLPRFDTLDTVLRRSQSVTAALKASGVTDYHRESTSIIGRLPSAAEARLLHQLPTQPIFECERLDADEDNRPILFGITKFSCERVRLTV
ncbi:MAG TPA: UTRA domain-containing protein [Devosiaceae bacterium]|jgi:GntR family phosphonate transport system transcriptional regulator